MIHWLLSIFKDHIFELYFVLYEKKIKIDSWMIKECLIEYLDVYMVS